MISSHITFRVRYCEVDRMGYVHHGNYAAYFEMGRTELMRQNGISYKELEDSGIIMPLSEYSVKFYLPALYDDELRLVTTLGEYTGVRLVFTYQLYNSGNELLAEAKTSLVFVNASSRKPARPSREVNMILSKFFNPSNG